MLFTRYFLRYCPDDVPPTKIADPTEESASANGVFPPAGFQVVSATHVVRLNLARPVYPEIPLTVVNVPPAYTVSP